MTNNILGYDINGKAVVVGSTCILVRSNIGCVGILGRSVNVVGPGINPGNIGFPGNPTDLVVIDLKYNEILALRGWPEIPDHPYPWAEASCSRQLMCIDSDEEYTQETEKEKNLEHI